MIQQASGCWLLGTHRDLGRLGKSLERYFRAAGERPGRVISGSGGYGAKKQAGVARTDRKECTDYGNFLDVHQAGGMVDRMH